MKTEANSGTISNRSTKRECNLTGKELAASMTLREHYAAMAMMGFLSNSFSDGISQPLSTASHEQIAEFSLRQADALILELNKESGQG